MYLYLWRGVAERYAIQEKMSSRTGQPLSTLRIYSEYELVQRQSF